MEEAEVIAYSDYSYRWIDVAQDTDLVIPLTELGP